MSLNILPRDTVLSKHVIQEVSQLKTVTDLEQFLLNHGEKVVDVLAVEVDRIERNVKVSSSCQTITSLRYCDGLACVLL